jgi:tetratricopeptide (TPR) repeat protein
VALFTATLLPICYVRLLSGAILAERFLFVPSAAIALGAALLPRGRDAGLAFLSAAAGVALWFLTLLAPRVAIWENEGTLYSSMLRDAPESPHVHGIIGDYYYRQRDLERAAEHFRRSYQLYPQSGVMLLNLGAAEDEMGMADSAYVHVRQLIALQPDYGPGWYALGNLHAKAERPDSARMAYMEAVRLKPDFAEAENNLGAVLERMGRFDEAMAHYRRALEIQPGYPEATNNLTRLGAELAARADSLAASRGARR